MPASLSRSTDLTHFLSLLLSLALVALVQSSRLVAQDVHADEEARALFEAGRAAFASGRYEEALSRFERAHELSARPELLYNIAVSADRLRRDARALEAFRRFLAEVPAAEARAEIEARIGILEQQLAEHVAPTTPPSPAPPEVGPPPAPDPPRPLPARDGSGEAVAIAGGAIAAAGLILAAVSGGLALSTDAALAGSCSPACPPSRVDELTVLTVTTDAGLGVALGGAALLAVGLALGVGGASADGTDVVLAPLPGGALLAVRGRLP